MLWVVFVPLGIFLILPSGNGYGEGARSAICQTTRAIGTAMYDYSLDHNGQYPTGKSSTEVFQKLIDGHYVSDPTIFYLTGCGSPKGEPRKTRATSNTLKPENVCFDVTVPISAATPKGLPIVFNTGFKITYESGASAVPSSDAAASSQYGGIAAVYKDDEHPSKLSIAWFGRFNVVYQDKPIKGHEVIPDLGSVPIYSNVIPHFIPDDFKPDGKPYQQLTPTGPLAP